MSHKLPHLHNGVDRTGLLAEAAVDALGHVDVVTGGPATTISTRLCLDGDSLAQTQGAAESTVATLHITHV